MNGGSLPKIGVCLSLGQRFGTRGLSTSSGGVERLDGWMDGKDETSTINSWEDDGQPLLRLRDQHVPPHQVCPTICEPPPIPPAKQTMSDVEAKLQGLSAQYQKLEEGRVTFPIIII